MIQKYIRVDVSEMVKQRTNINEEQCRVGAETDTPTTSYDTVSQISTNNGLKRIYPGTSVMCSQSAGILRIFVY